MDYAFCVILEPRESNWIWALHLQAGALRLKEAEGGSILRPECWVISEWEVAVASHALDDDSA
jgi:hypothetical protein